MNKSKNYLITLPLLLILLSPSGSALATQPPGRTPATAQQGPKHVYTGQAANAAGNANSAGPAAVKDAKAARTSKWQSVCANMKTVNADGSPNHCQ